MNIKFSTQFQSEFDGTATDLSQLIDYLQKLSPDQLTNNASSITYDVEGFDTIIEIKI